MKHNGYFLLCITLATIIGALWLVGTRRCGASWELSIGIGGGALFGVLFMLLAGTERHAK